MPASILQRFAVLDSAAISDALDQLGLPAGVGGLSSITVATPIVGFARTAVLEPYRPGVPGPHLLTGVIDEAGADDVIVIDNAGRRDASCFGGILGIGAASRGIRGVIADGVCRDVDELRELGLPVYARGGCPVTARGRIQQLTTGGPATIAGRTVRQGDVVFADGTGLVVVPADRIEEVLAAAEALVQRERAIVAEIRAGVSLSSAMLDARLAGTVASA